LHYYEHFIRELQLKNTSNNNTVSNNFVTSPTSGKSFRYNKLRDSYAHEMNNDVCLTDFKSYWKPSFDLHDDIINMKYFDSHTCMTYDDYADLQQTQKQTSNENAMVYATADHSMKSIKSHRRSSGASDRSDRLSATSDDGVYESGGKIQISINGLANTMTTNPLSINATHKTPQTKCNHNSDSENSDDDINDNVTNAARKRSPTAIEVQAEIERHLENSKHTAMPRKGLPMNYVVSNDNQDDYSESSSSSSESSSDDDQEFGNSYKKKNKHILLAKKLAKTTKISSLISNAVCNREIQLDELEHGSDLGK
jgi:hypothetical protein